MWQAPHRKATLKDFIFVAWDDNNVFAADTICFHAPSVSLVPWTHAYFFNKTSHAEGYGPNEVSMAEEFSFCVPFTKRASEKSKTASAALHHTQLRSQ